MTIGKAPCLSSLTSPASAACGTMRAPSATAPAKRMSNFRVFMPFSSLEVSVRHRGVRSDRTMFAPLFGIGCLSSRSTAQHAEGLGETGAVGHGGPTGMISEAGSGRVSGGAEDVLDERDHVVGYRHRCLGIGMVGEEVARRLRRGTERIPGEDVERIERPGIGADLLEPLVQPCRAPCEPEDRVSAV